MANRPQYKMAEMNCLSARRIISTDVSDKSTEFIEHIKGCNSCKSFYEKQLKFNSVLKKAFEVDVPDGLAARVLVEHNLNKKKANSDKFRWGTIAASVVLAFVVSAVSTFHSPPALADAILAHVKYDEAAFEIKSGITLEELNALLKPHGVRADASIGQATNAGNCVIEGKVGAHIVFSGQNSPVTLIVLPESLDDNKRVLIDDQQYKGVLMSTRKGTLALLSEDEDSLRIFEDRLKTSLMTFI